MQDDQRTQGLTLDRRRMLQALGAGTALAGLGTGTAAADDHDYPEELVSGDDVHPVFGFSALEADAEPPVEPDHEIETMIRPVEGREIPEFFYEPTGLFIEPGDTVRFTFTTPHHTITAYHPAFGQVQRVPDGVPPFSSPVLGGGAYWLYTFEAEGVYDIHCGPHESFGHAGRIVAGSATGPGAEPLPEPEDEGEGESDGEDGAEDESEGEGEELRPPVFAAGTVLGDPALDPERIVDRGRVSWDEIADENKELPF